MHTYRFIGDETYAFVTIQRNCDPGEVFESPVPLHHPLLEEVKAVKESKETVAVPETIEDVDVDPEAD